MEKAALYFNSGAREVWVCGGELSFFGPGLAPLETSGLCPAFPKQLELP